MFVFDILLSVLLILQSIYFIYYKRQIKAIGKQLAFISEHDSFKFIHTQIKPKEISHLIGLCNTMLRKNRELNQEFIHKSSEINETIVSLSHDIRTPLTSLDGYLQLANRVESTEEKSNYLALASTRIKQLNRLVDELFLYTKLQNPAYTLELGTMTTVNVLKNSLFTFLDDFTKRETEPQLELLDDSPTIEGNENALERVFENIIKNYFVHGKGDLNIIEEENEKGVKIHFRNALKHEQSVDFGKIFTRFYKVDASRSQQSTGLGLSIVKSLMLKMNGNTQATLEDNQFTLTLTFMKGSSNGD